MRAHDRAMDREHRGRGFVIWTIAWAVVVGALLVLAATSSHCDTSINKFCGLGSLILVLVAAGAGLIWLVGMAIGALVVMLTRPSRPRCPACKDPYRPGTAECPTCGEPLDDADT